MSTLLQWVCDRNHISMDDVREASTKVAQLQNQGSQWRQWYPYLTFQHHFPSSWELNLDSQMVNRILEMKTYGRPASLLLGATADLEELLSWAPVSSIEDEFWRRNQTEVVPTRIPPPAVLFNETETFVEAWKAWKEREFDLDPVAWWPVWWDWDLEDMIWVRHLGGFSAERDIEILNAWVRPEIEHRALDIEILNAWVRPEIEHRALEAAPMPTSASYNCPVGSPGVAGVAGVRGPANQSRPRLHDIVDPEGRPRVLVETPGFIEPSPSPSTVYIPAGFNQGELSVLASPSSSSATVSERSSLSGIYTGTGNASQNLGIYMSPQVFVRQVDPSEIPPEDDSEEESSENSEIYQDPMRTTSEILVDRVSEIFEGNCTIRGRLAAAFHMFYNENRSGNPAHFLLETARGWLGEAFRPFPIIITQVLTSVVPQIPLEEDRDALRRHLEAFACEHYNWSVPLDQQRSRLVQRLTGIARAFVRPQDLNAPMGETPDSSREILDRVMTAYRAPGREDPCTQPNQHTEPMIRDILERSLNSYLSYPGNRTAPEILRGYLDNQMQRLLQFLATFQSQIETMVQTATLEEAHRDALRGMLCRQVLAFAETETPTPVIISESLTRCLRSYGIRMLADEERHRVIREEADFDFLGRQSWDDRLTELLYQVSGNLENLDLEGRRATLRLASERWLVGAQELDDCLTALASSGEVDVISEYRDLVNWILGSVAEKIIGTEVVENRTVIELVRYLFHQWRVRRAIEAQESPEGTQTSLTRYLLIRTSTWAFTEDLNDRINQLVQEWVGLWQATGVEIRNILRDWEGPLVADDEARLTQRIWNEWPSWVQDQIPGAPLLEMSGMREFINLHLGRVEGTIAENIDRICNHRISPEGHQYVSERAGRYALSRNLRRGWSQMMYYLYLMRDNWLYLLPYYDSMIIRLSRWAGGTPELQTHLKRALLTIHEDGGLPPPEEVYRSLRCQVQQWQMDQEARQSRGRVSLQSPVLPSEAASTGPVLPGIAGTVANSYQHLAPAIREQLYDYLLNQGNVRSRSQAELTQISQRWVAAYGRCQPIVPESAIQETALVQNMSSTQVRDLLDSARTQAAGMLASIPSGPSQ